ncbi:hypothetical protein [Effusibacillus consociatus]|uniref:DUF4258 domain-containing protein n=1 Tax=Effusibacillus consociatus TaxID=1117041 RepID=A0ABV9PYW3_9BACL
MRVTAVIRKILELEIFEQQISQQMRGLKQQLRQKDISILERHNRPLDIWIQYRWNGRVHEVVFMRSMLDAEMQGLLRRWVGEER